MSRRTGWRRWLLLVFGLVAALGSLALALLLAFGLFLTTERGNRWLEDRLVQAAGAALAEGKLEVESLQTSWPLTLQVQGLRLQDGAGKPLIQVDSALVEVDPGPLLAGRLHIPRLELSGGRVEVTTRADGSLDLLALFSSEPADPNAPPGQGLPLPLVVDALSVDGLTVVLGTVDQEQLRLVGLGLRARVEAEGWGGALREIEAFGHLATPGPLPFRVTGEVVGETTALERADLRLEVPGTALHLTARADLDQLAAGLTVDQADLRTFDPLAGYPGLQGQLLGHLQAEGPWEAVVLGGSLHGSGATRGGLTLDGSVDLAAERLSWKASLLAADLHVADFYPAVGADDPVQLEGRFVLDGAGSSYPDDLEANLRYEGAAPRLFGQSLDEVGLEVGLAAGVLTVRPTRVVGLLGLLEATGDVQLEQGPLAVRVTGSLEPDRLAALGVPGIRSTGRLDVRLTGDLTQPALPLGVRGRVWWPQLRADPGVEVADVEVGLDLTVRGAEVEGMLSLSTGEGSAQGIGFGPSLTPRLVLRVAADGTVGLEGDTVLEGVRSGDDVRLGASRATWSVLVPAGGDPRVDAFLDLGPLVALGIPSPGGTASLALDGDQARLALTLAGGEEDLLSLAGAVDLRAQRVEISRLALNPTPRQRWTAQRPVQLRWRERGVEGLVLDLAGPLGSLVAEGTFGTTGLLDGSLRVEGLHLDVLPELFPERAPEISGTLDLALQLTGSAQAPQVEGAVGLERFWFTDQVQSLDLAGTVLGAGPRALQLDLSLGSSGQQVLLAQGALPVSLDLASPALLPDDPVSLRFTLLAGSLGRLAQLSPALRSLPTGTLAANLALEGPLRDPDLKLSLVAGADVPRWVDPARVELQAWRRGGAVHLLADLGEGYRPRGRLRLDGVTRIGEVLSWALEGGAEPDFSDYSLFLDDLAGALTLDGLPVPAVLAAAGARLPVAGVLAGELKVQGSPFTPTVDGDLALENGQVGGLAVKAARLGLHPEAGGYGLNLLLDFGEQGGTRVAGHVPVSPDLRRPTEEWITGDLDLKVSGGGLPLGLLALADSGVRGATGQLVLAGAVTGSPLDPRPELTATLKDGALSHAGLGLALDKVELDLRLDRDLLHLKKLRAHTQPLKGLAQVETDRSFVDANGKIELKDWAPTHVRIKTRLQDSAFVLATSEARVRLDGEVRVEGDWPALNVTGDVALGPSAITLDAASFLTVAPLELDPMLQVDRGPLVEVVTEVEEGPPLYHDFLVDVKVDLQRNLDLSIGMPFLTDFGSLSALVSRLDLDARLAGDLKVTLEEGEPTLVGEVGIVSGTTSVMRSQFDLTESKIVFTGADYTEPDLDVSAVMAVTGATVDLRIRGTPSAPTVDFSSEEYPDQSQILTILLTGQAPDALTADQGQGTASALAGLLLNSLFSGLGSFSIEPDGSVRVGVPVSQSIYASTSVDPSPGLNENALTLEVDWSVLPKVVVSGGFGVPNTWGDIFWELRF